MTPPLCAPGSSMTGRLFFVDALGVPSDGDGDPVDPEDATHLLYDGVLYELQPGDVFLALVDDDEASGTIWVVPEDA